MSYRFQTLFGLALLACLFGCVTNAFGEGQLSEYLPFSVGRQWVLRSKTSPKPIVLEVLSQHGNEYQLKFDNPWVPSELSLVVDHGKYYVSAVTMGGQTNHVSSNALYWDLTAHEGASWSSSIGSEKVISRNKQVKANGTNYQHCVEIRETNSQGNQLFWTFAPGIGFVQFGEDAWAFVLESTRTGSPEAPPTETSAPASAPREKTTGHSAMYIGLGANPFANEGFNAHTVNARFSQAQQAGVNFLYLSPKWNELETSPGHYNFKDLDFQIGQIASSGFMAALNLRIIDTNQRAMPRDLMSKDFADPEMQKRLLAILDAITARAGGRIQYYLVGNEVDGYFKDHASDARGYAELFAKASARIKEKVHGAQVSFSTTFDGLMMRTKTLSDAAHRADYLAVTYYPLSPDFRVRGPESVASDFAQIFAAAGNQQILMQEIGYPSGSGNGSSEDRQAAVYAAVLDQLAAHPHRFIAANFLFMSDFSDSVVDGLAKYYSMPGADRFRSFLKTLGLFDGQGHPKKSWAVFQSKVPALTHG